MATEPKKPTARKSATKPAGAAKDPPKAATKPTAPRRPAPANPTAKPAPSADTIRATLEQRVVEPAKAAAEHTYEKVSAAASSAYGAASSAASNAWEATGDARESAKEAAESARETLTAAATQGSAFGLKMIEHAEANAREAFIAMRAAAKSKDVSEVLKVQGEFLREQGARSLNQAREVGELIAQFGRDAIAPITGKKDKKKKK